MKKLFSFLAFIALSFSVRAYELTPGLKTIYDMRQISGPKDHPWAWIDPVLEAHQFKVMFIPVIFLVLIAVALFLVGAGKARHWTVFGVFAIGLMVQMYLVIDYVHAVHVRAVKPEPFKCGYVFQGAKPHDLFSLAYEQPYSCMRAGEQVILLMIEGRVAILPTSDMEPYKLK